MRISYICIFIALLSAGCSTHGHLANGFYHLSDDDDNRIIGRPIVTVEDFDRVSMQSEFDGTPVIDIMQDKDKALVFANATEAAIGHHIGFVYNDSVIMSPRVNTRIDGGRSQITSPDTTLLRKIYEDIKK